jgi:hypothetical protein
MKGEFIMPSLACTIDGWRARALKTWYPTDGSWRATSATQPINASISCPVYDNGSTSDNKYTVCIKITTPTDVTIGTINSISVSFYVGDRNTTAGTMYGSLRTVDTATGSDANDTLDTYRTNVAGNSNEASVTGITTTEAQHTMTFNGTFEQGTSYYLYLYTKSTGDIYSCTPHSSYYTSTCTYDIKTYDIIYYANGHGKDPEKQSKVHGTTLTLRKAIANEIGTGYMVEFDPNGSSSPIPSPLTSSITYTQLNWNTKPDGSGITYAPGALYTNDTTLTLYAIWSYTLGSIVVADSMSRPNSDLTYTITYNANGGNTVPSTQVFTRSTPYYFKEWNTKSDGSGISYNPGDSMRPNEATTLYAIWTTGTTTGSINLASKIVKENIKETGYTVTLSANGGNIITDTLTSVNTRSYTFIQWNTAADGTGTGYNANDIYSESSDIVLYAIFTSSITAVSSVNLPIPEKYGYKFLGWSLVKEDVSYVNRNYTPSGNTTLYANYKQGYDIEMYIYNGGRWMNVLMPASIIKSFVIEGATDRLLVSYIDQYNTWKDFCDSFENIYGFYYDDNGAIHDSNDRYIYYQTNMVYADHKLQINGIYSASHVVTKPV